MCQYLNPGCKITAINGESVKGLSYHEMITKLERAKTSMVLSIEEPTGFLLEESSLSSRNTWPLETEHECLIKSPREGQIHYTSSSIADKNLQRTDLTCKHKQQSPSDVACDAKPMSLSASGSMPPASDYNTGFNDGASSSPGCRSIHQEPGTPLLVPLEPHDHETPTEQHIRASQDCLPNTTPDKRKQTIDHIPGKIYHCLCTNLDILSRAFDDYRLLGEKLQFPPQEIYNLSSSKQPTCELLNTWLKRKGNEATVEVLLGVFHEMGRQDLWQLLQNWVKNCAN